MPVQVLAGCQHTLAELEQVHAALTARREELAARSIHLREWGPDIAQNRVRVGLARVTPAAKAWLEQEFGAETIAVFESGGW